MDAQKSKAVRATRRKQHVRKNVRGTAAKPRLSVYRSNQHIYVQLIDDEAGKTLASASTNEKGASNYGGNISAATTIGKAIAEKAKAKGITIAAFDRGAYRFHGRVKALARAATDAGLKCTGAPDAPKEPKADAPNAVAPAKKKK
jgi:large subunit ribosomal protein L18